MTAPRRVKELKIVVPAELYFRLRAYKLLRGKTIARAVTEALDQHFLRLEQESRGRDRGPEEPGPAGPASAGTPAGSSPPR